MPLNLRSQSLRPLFALLRTKDIDPSPLRQRFGLPDAAEADPDFELPVDRLEALLHEAAQLSGDASIGVHLALNLQRGAYGLIEYMALNAPSFQRSVELLAGFSRLINPLVRYDFARDGHEGRLSQRTAGRRHGLGRHLNEFNLVALLQMGRSILRTRWVPTRVWFAHPTPKAELAELKQAFGTSRFTFDAATNGFAMSTKLLDRPVPHADPKLLELLLRSASAELASLPAEEAVVARTRAALLSSMREGRPPRVSGIAKALHMSARTLHRRLMDEQTDFQHLVDQVREASAKQLLIEGKAHFAEVAFLLGFQDPHSFGRAFKRWTGMSPGQYVRTTAPCDGEGPRTK